MPAPYAPLVRACGLTLCLIGLSAIVHPLIAQCPQSVIGTPTRSGATKVSPTTVCDTGGTTPPQYCVTVTPKGATEPLRSANSSASRLFTVANCGTQTAGWTLSCSAGSPVTCVSVSPGNVSMTSGTFRTVTASYNTGNPGNGSLTVSAAGLANDDGYVTVPVGRTVAVTPDGQAVSADPGATQTVTFDVFNSAQVSDNYGFACSATGSETCQGVSPASLPLDPQTHGSVTVTYTSGASGETGTVILTATSLVYSTNVTDAGSYNVTSGPGPAPTVSLAPYSGGRRNASDFDGTVSHSTPSYFSMGAARGFSLSYNASTVQPTPIVRLDVTPAAPYPTTYGVQLQIVGGPLLTLFNGSQSVYYAAGTGVSRLVAALDAKANGLTTGWYDVNAIVTSYWPGGTRTSTLTTHILVEDESKSAFGAGWSAAGIPRIYTKPGSYSALVTEGDGSMSFFQRDAADVPFVSPAGDATTLSLTTDPTKGTIYRRTSLDGSYVDFTADGRMWRAVVPYKTMTVLSLEWTDTLLTRIRDLAGKAMTLAYAGGKLQTATDPAGRVTRYAVDSLLTKITEASGDTTRFVYDNVKRLTTITDNAGASTDLAYDAINQLASTTGPSFQDYTGASVRSTVTLLSPDRHVWQPAVPGTSAGAPKLNSADTLLTGSVTDPLGVATRFTVDRFGQPLQVTDPRGMVTRIDRDTLGQTIKITAPNNTGITTFGYSGYLLTVQSDQFTGARVIYDYNSANIPITIRGDVTRTDIYYRPAYAGGPLNGPVDSVYSGNVTSSYARDSGGTMMARHIVNQWGQDSVVIDGQGHQTTVLYADTAQFGGPAKVIDPLGRIVAKYHYDNAGRVDTSWAMSAGAYVPTSQTYDPLNRVLSTKDPLGYVTRYGYATTGLNRVTDPKGQVYKFGLNALGMIVAQHDLADTTRADTVKYDVAGRARQMRTRRSDLISFTYDSITGNLLTRSGPDFPADTFRYEALGRWLVATNSNAYDSISYDANGHVTTWVERLAGASTYTLTYTYDAQSRVVTRSALSRGTPVRVTYDPTKGTITRFCAAAACASPQAFDADYIPHTTAYTDTLLNPSWSRADTTDAAHLETSNGSINNTGTPMDLSAFRNTWTYDSLGRVTREGPGCCGPIYVYDAAGELVSACSWIYPAPPARPLCYDEYGTHTNANSYAYDPAGNRIDSLAGTVVAPGNRTTTFKGYVLTYDANGNVITKNGANSQWGTDSSSYTWDALGRLKSVTTWPAGGAHSTVTFAYDAAGRRVSKTVNGVTQWYAHEGDQVTMILDSLGQRLKLELGWAPGTDNLAFVRTGSWTAVAITTPQIGTLRGLASPTPGAPLRKQYIASALGPWGETAADTGTVVPFRLAGAEYDQETKLYYMRARYYDPQLGRFLSEDPVGIAGGLNLYAYAGNDPVNQRDPSGLWCISYYLSATEFTIGTSVGGSQTQEGEPGSHRTECYSPYSGEWGLMPARLHGDFDQERRQMHELDSGGGGLGNGLVRGRSLGQQGPSCGAAIATAIGTALLDASFFVGVGEAIELARISRLVGREAISLARRGLWRQTGHLAYQASLLARDASSAVNVGNLVRDVGGIGFTTTAAGFSGGGVAVGDLNVADFIPGAATVMSTIRAVQACRH